MYEIKQRQIVLPPKCVGTVYCHSIAAGTVFGDESSHCHKKCGIVEKLKSLVAKRFALNPPKSEVQI